jgi:hypothetical protein
MMKNRLRRGSFLLIIFFLISQCLFIDEAWAKKRRNFSSRKKSSYSKQKSKSKGSGFSFSSKKKTTYSSRSKTSKTKGSIFHPSTKKTSRGTSLAQAAKRAESQSKFRNSIGGQQMPMTYRQVVSKNRGLAEFLTVKNAYSRNKRRTAFYDSHSPSNDSYYQYTSRGYNDPYDNLFFRYVTLTWLFHHWDSIDKSRFEPGRLQEVEAKIQQMEEEGMEPDPHYTMLAVDPDLQYSDEELADLQEAKDVIDFESGEPESTGGFAWITMFLICLVAVGGVYFVAIRRY